MKDIPSRPRILAIDDEPQVLNAIEDLLEDEYDVTTTTSFEQALTCMAEHDLAVILSDQRMPDMTGDELLERATGVSDAERVLVTGYADLDAISRAVNNGRIFAYISKPWDPEGFRETVRKAVEHRDLLRAIAYERSLLRALMEHSPDPIFFKDRDGCFVRANQPTADVYNVSDPQRLIGRRASDFLDGELLAEIEAEDAAASGGCSSLSDRCLPIKGQDHWFSVRKAPYSFDGKDVDGYVGIKRDITERKKAEEAVRMVNKIAIRIGEKSDVRAALRIALNEICMHYEWAHGSAYMPDENGTMTRIEAWCDSDPRTILYSDTLAKKRIDSGPGLVHEVMTSNQHTWAPDVLDEEMPIQKVVKQHMIDAGFRSACAMPVLAGKALTAVFVFYMREKSDDTGRDAEAVAACIAPLGHFLERMKSETALREADEQLNQALRSARIGTWRYRVGDQAMTIDEHMLGLLGLAPGTFRQTLGEFEAGMSPEDRAAFSDSLGACTAEGDEFEVEFRVQCAGRTRVLSARGKARQAEDGSISVIGAATDISEIRSLVDFHSENPFPVFRISSDGEILEANSAAGEFLKRGPCSGEGPDSQWWQVAEIPLATGKSGVVERECGDKVFRFNVVPVSAKQYCNVYGEEITEQKKNEAMIRTMQKMQAVGELTGGIAHDFNNRLTVIMGNLELLEMQFEDDDDVLELIRAARGGAEGGAKLTRQLLAFSRSQVLETARLDINELLGDIDQLIGRTMGDTVKLTLECTAEPWPINVDRNQLEDVVINLAVNARHALPNGGELRIETANRRISESDVHNSPFLNPGDYLMLAVSDDGVGMSAEIQERLFEPFFTTREKDKGTGLGLAMVYGFVKQSGGSILVDSTEGVGARFEIYLPRMLETAPICNPQGEPANVEKSARILVVEDEPSVRLLATSLLEKLGYDVVEAEDGPSALRVLEHDPDVDLLFTDMMMPGDMTGMQLGKSVRERWPGLPIVYTSGYTSDEPFAGADCNVYLVRKPYDRGALQLKIQKALTGNGYRADHIQTAAAWQGNARSSQ